MMFRRCNRVIFCLIGLACTAGALAEIRWTPLNEPGVGGRLTSIRVDPQNPQVLFLGGDMLGLAKSSNGGETWERSKGLVSYEVADFSFDPKDRKVVWAGTMSGPHRSRDGGKTWNLAREGMPPISSNSYSAPVERILFDPVNHKRLLAFGGNHRLWKSPGEPKWGVVWESLNGGDEWSEFSVVEEGANIMAAEWPDSKPETIYTALGDAGIYRSDDGGQSWGSIRGGLPKGAAVNDLVVHPQNGNIIWAALGSSFDSEKNLFLAGGIYKSMDGGMNWERASEGLSQEDASQKNQASWFKVVEVS
ncbi:MAG: hypothetical protein AAF558_13915, partial [Verrucomicrobiota bacterium]